MYPPYKISPVFSGFPCPANHSVNSDEANTLSQAFLNTRIPFHCPKTYALISDNPILINNLFPSSNFLYLVKKKICSPVGTDPALQFHVHMLCCHIFIFHGIKAIAD